MAEWTGDWIKLLDRVKGPTIEVRVADLQTLVEHCRAVEANRNALVRLLMEAHRIMEGPGRTDEKLRKAGHVLKLTDKERSADKARRKNKYEAIADRYWELRFGIPPDDVRGPKEPMSKEQAEAVIEEEFNICFDTLRRDWANNEMDVNTGKPHWTWRNPKPEK